MQPLTFYIGSGSAIKVNALKEALLVFFSRAAASHSFVIGLQHLPV